MIGFGKLLLWGWGREGKIDRWVLLRGNVLVNYRI